VMFNAFSMWIIFWHIFAIFLMFIIVQVLGHRDK
jgi:hypothetical protein